MKKRIITGFLLVFAMIVSAICVSCTGGGKTDSSQKDIDPSLCDKIEIEVTTSDITIVEDDVEGFDYTAYFIIYGDGKKLKTKSEYIDASGVLIRVGTYTVVCRVKDRSAEITVHVNSSGKVTEVKVTALKTRIDIKDDEIATYDFASLFRITEDGSVRTTLLSDIDLSALKPQKGGYIIYCKYKGKEASLMVYVTETAYAIRVAKDKVAINVSEVATYNYAKLFTVTREGEEFIPDNSMIKGNVLPKAGEYTITLSLGKVQKSITVTVTDSDVAVFYKAYASIKMPLEDAKTYEFYKDFYLYVNGKITPVDKNKVDTSEIDGASAGDTVKVWYRYSDELADYIEVEITIDDVVIKAKNVEVFSNSVAVDLTSLFEISVGGITVEVTPDMISGEVDYTKPGSNQITLNYKGRTAVAIVTVKTGLIVDYANGEKVIIKRGTDKSLYDFSKDFIVTVNGIVFDDISQFISADDIQNVDFNTVGQYTVSVSLPFNDKSIGISGVKFTNIEKTITYDVVLNDYSLSVVSEKVVLRKGETSFNAFSNISLVINGINQIFTQNKSQVNIQVCYGEQVGSIDFNSLGKQTVKLKLYVDGADQAPVEIEYTVLIISDTYVYATDAAIFAGDEICVSDLFKIKSDGEMIPVTEDMITGRFDAFTPGVYSLTVSYGGVSATAEITVLDKEFTGEYFTPCMTVSEEAEVDADGDVISDAKDAKALDDLVIGENLNISRGKNTATNIKSVDLSTFTFVFGTQVYNTYTLYYSDGVAALVYDNSLRMKLGDSTRPALYFNKDVWTVTDKIIINSAKSGIHVLQSTSANYTLELFKARKTDGTVCWFGLKIRLVSYMGNDYNYSIDFGKAEFSDGFNGTVGQSATVILADEMYSFKVTGEHKGSINSDADVNPFKGKTFSGKVDGKNANLTVSSNGTLKLVSGTDVYFSLAKSEVSAMQYDAFDLSAKTLTVYGIKIASTSVSSGATTYEYSGKFDKKAEDTVYVTQKAEPFAYKFVLNETDNTFELLSKDKFFGLFTNGDNYFFFDGYGRGVTHYKAQSSYTENLISYEAYGRDLVVKYENAPRGFAYGESVKLTLNADDNTYTIMQSDGGAEKDEIYENYAILNGVIVKVNQFVFKQGSKVNDLLNQITIKNKDGYVEGNDKKALVNTKAVAFSKPGFYQFIVNDTQYYAIMVVDKRYEGNYFAKNFASSLTGSSSLYIDEYGFLTFIFGDRNFTGLVNISDSGFIGSAKDSNGNRITLYGKEYVSGVISVEVEGALSASEYFTAYSSFAAGNGAYVLRAINTGSEYEYYLSKSEFALGEKVELSFVSGTEFKSGSIVSVKKLDGTEIKFKIDALSDLKAGLVEIDALAGEYTSSNGVTLSLDGFGNATFGETKGTYVSALSDGVRYVLFKNAAGTVYKKLSLNLNARTFVDNGDVLTGEILGGKSFAREIAITFEEGDYVFVKFAFGVDGSVEITAKNGEASSSGTPDYVGKGTFTVAVDTITVTVKSYTFTFKTDDPIGLDSLTVTSSSASGDEVYIRSGNVFDRV